MKASITSYYGRLSGLSITTKKAVGVWFPSLENLAGAGFTQAPGRIRFRASGIEFNADYNQQISSYLKINAEVHFSTITNKVLDLLENGEKMCSCGLNADISN